MALTKVKEIDQIIIEGNGKVLWRETTRILEDGEEISKQYFRGSATADDDQTVIPVEVQAHRALAATPEKVAAAKAKKAPVQKGK